MIHKSFVRSRLARGLATAVALVGLAGTVQLATAGTASAAVSRVVSASSGPADSTARKVATASCPSGMRVFGGGGDIVGGKNGVSLTGLRPVSTASGDSFVVTAEEDAVGYSGSWNVYAYALCGFPLPNMTVQTFTRSSTAGATELFASTACPAGTAPLGLGAQINGGNGHVVLHTLFGNYVTGPYGAPTSFSKTEAFVTEGGYGGTWSLTSYAVCASPPPDLTYQFADSVLNSADKTASVQCPSGTRAYAAGGYLDYNDGQTHFDRMAPHGTNWDGTEVDAREDQTGAAYGWFTQVEAICGR